MIYPLSDELKKRLFAASMVMIVFLRYSGGYSTRVPPLPIPNREVKPCHADGTAFSGRVGSCRFSEAFDTEMYRRFFVFLYEDFIEK